MEIYRDRGDGSLKNKNQIKAENPDVSLPYVWTDATLDGLNVDYVHPTSPPTLSENEIAVDDGVVQDSDGDWNQSWRIDNIYTEYMGDSGQVVTVQDQMTLEERRGMTCSNMSLRLALHDAGVYQSLESSTTFSTDPSKEIRFKFSPTINRLDSWLIEASQGILDSEELDDLFESAKSFNY